MTIVETERPRSSFRIGHSADTSTTVHTQLLSARCCHHSDCLSVFPVQHDCCEYSVRHITAGAACCLSSASSTTRYRCYHRKHKFCSAHVFYVHPRSTAHMGLYASLHRKHVKRPPRCFAICHVLCRADPWIICTVLRKRTSLVSPVQNSNYTTVTSH